VVAAGSRLVGPDGRLQFAEMQVILDFTDSQTFNEVERLGY
jgi:hypothetical protein